MLVLKIIGAVQISRKPRNETSKLYKSKKGARNYKTFNVLTKNINKIDITATRNIIANGLCERRAENFFDHRDGTSSQAEIMLFDLKTLFLLDSERDISWGSSMVPQAASPPTVISSSMAFFSCKENLLRSNTYLDLAVVLYYHQLQTSHLCNNWL